MKKLNPIFLAAMADSVNKSPYYVHTSMAIKEIYWGYCLMQLAVQEKHLQPYGMVHGGVYAAMVDSAAYWAVFTQLDDNAKMITIDLKLNY
ncbi:MAG: PaaI family thioesterase, partial [Deltaproteobacteria bacterium]|nr:PaaI family thioesterase [Deltaproteobacteria bacterium]